MIIEMKKISVTGPNNELKVMIDALKSTNSFEHTPARISNKDLEFDSKERDTLSGKMSRIKNIIELEKKFRREFNFALKKHNTFLNKSEDYENIVSQFDTSKLSVNSTEVYEMVYSEFKNIAEKEMEVLALMDRMEEVGAKISETNQSLARNKALISDLTPYIHLNANFRVLHDTSKVFVLAGVIPQEMFLKFKSDFDLGTIIIQEYKSVENKVCVIFIGLHEHYPIANAVFEYGFEKCKLNYDVNAREKIAEVEEQNIKLYYDNLILLNDACLNKEEVKLLKCYHDFLKNEIETELVVESTIKTQDNYILNGWIVAREENKILDLIKRTSDNSTVKISKATNKDNPPTLVVNKTLIAPYESITNLYSPPSNKDLDPNFFVALFYFLFFGIMIGDVGYGIIMFMVSLAILLFNKPQRGAKSLIMIICMGGVSSILWGIFFGSIFGLTKVGVDGTAVSLIPAVIDPINDSLVFLIATLALGVVHLLMGIILNFYNLIRHKRVLDAICDGLFRIALFVGLILFGCGMFLEGAQGLSTPGMYIALTSVVLIFLTAGRKKKGIFGKLTGGFGGLYSLVNYFSDVISYARLFGLGLVGSVIAMVANLMAQMLFGIPILGVVLGFLIAAVFHIFNLAIGILSAYVHNARLQFVEFFGKFYEGNGREFVPLGSKTQFVRIKSIF